MLTKRRLTVLPVDGACFSGDYIVSFRNGADHVRPTPVPTEDPPEPFDSRVLAHTYGGAQGVDGWLSERDEYVRGAGVCAVDGVVACRISELPTGNPFRRVADPAGEAASSSSLPSPSSSGAGERKEKIVFFSGRHRLSEMFVAAADEMVLSGGGKLTRQERQSRHPLLCLRAPQGLHVAVFARNESGITACVSRGDGWYDHERGILLGRATSQGADGRFVSMRNRERWIQFDGRTIACMGAGRGGSRSAKEVTLLLEDHTIAVYGFPTEAREANGSHAGLDEDGFPAFEAVLTCSFPADAPPTNAAPVRVVWSGRSTLWMVYEDGTVCALQWGSASRQRGTSGADEEGAATSAEEADVHLAFVGKLCSPSLNSNEASVVLERLTLRPDARTAALHYSFGLQGDAKTGTLYYGAVRLPQGAATTSAAVQADLTAQQRSLAFGEHVYGIRYDAGRYHLLTQRRQGEGPLTITSLPRAPPAPGPGEAVPLSLQMMYDPEERLGLHCRNLEAAIRGVNDASVRGGVALRSEADVMQALAQLQEYKQCVHALLCREQQQERLQQAENETYRVGGGGDGGRGVPSIRKSYPQRLLQQLTRKYTEVSVYLLLSQLGCLDEKVERPFREALSLQECRERAAATEATLKEFITATTFPVSVETDAVHAKLWPAKVTLCVDTILADLGVSSDFSLAQVLAQATSMSPVLALLVLYYVHSAHTFPGMTTAGGADAAAPPVDCVAHQQANDMCQSFLTQCNLPATSLNTWAFVSCAVDRGVDPTARVAAPEEQAGALVTQEAPFVYPLGAAVGHLDAPPLLALLPALVNGLMNSFAMDTAHRLMGTTLTLYGAGEELPPALGLKLLFIALQARADRDVETVYVRSRGTPLEAVATQALALAVLRSGDVAPIRGLVKMGSVQERLVEAALRGCENVALRQQVLLRFYILMQRFADALAVCESMANRDGVDGQRLSTVASHLRSLLPHGNTSYMRSVEVEGTGGAGSSSPPPSSSSPPPPPSLQSHAASSSSSAALLRHASHIGWAGVAPTPLENSPGETEAQLRRAVEQFAMAGPSRGGAAIGSQPRASTTSGAAVMRPSSILSSLDRPSSHSRDTDGSVLSAQRLAAASAPRQPFTNAARGGGGGAVDADSGVQPPARDRTASFLDPHTDSDTSLNRSTQGPSQRLRVGDPMGGAAALPMTCEAVLQRSGKVCGRPRPCMYHDRK